MPPKRLDGRPLSVKQWLEDHRANLDVAYQTPLGAALVGKTEEVLATHSADSLKGQCQLVFTSPPFPLNRKKAYGNVQGEAYKTWLKEYALALRDLVRADGSIVLELGNAWEPGVPVMSTLAIESLLEFKKAAGLYLCQEFIWHNPAKLPTPAQWVNVERIRVKDSFTRLWWMSTTQTPKADNRRVLAPYSDSMRTLLRTGKYNAGERPSGHVIGDKSFLKNNGGAIPPSVVTVAHEEDERDVPGSVLVGANTRANADYIAYCEANDLDPHPARMPAELAEFFVKLCTEPGDLVFDPFGGSNTTGAAAERLNRQWISVEANRDYALSGRSHFIEKPKAVKERTREARGSGKRTARKKTGRRR